jgi:hypothetical protein
MHGILFMYSSLVDLCQKWAAALGEGALLRSPIVLFRGPVVLFPDELVLLQIAGGKPRKPRVFANSPASTMASDVGGDFGVLTLYMRYQPTANRGLNILYQGVRSAFHDQLDRKIPGHFLKIVMIFLVVFKTRVFVMLLQLFLIKKMFDGIISQEIQAFLQFIFTLTRFVRINKVVKGHKKLLMLRVDLTVPGL